ncbi:hypothetical protein ACA910_021135 [Epithemia clementina (nom. ined.)]
MRQSSVFLVIQLLLVVTTLSSIPNAHGFAIQTASSYDKLKRTSMVNTSPSSVGSFKSERNARSATTSTQRALAQDLDVIALVAGQENYGLAVVAIGEGLYSFLQSPSLENIKVLVPPVIAAILLFVVSGPMITSGDAAAAGTGLWIATAVSLGLGASYVLRLLAPPYETFAPKEIASLGLLVAVAGFFSFGQNLLVDGFVTLPSIPLPQILPMPPSDNFL